METVTSRLERPRPRSGAAAMPELDALRGIAIVCVFAQHLGDRFMPLVARDVTAAAPAAIAPWILTALYHAWWGVDLFFVLSGFTLALGYLHAFERGAPPSAVTFWKRRAARILPAFWVALAVTLVAHWRVVFEPGFATTLAVHAAMLQGYACPPASVLIGAAWSLTTETHFYLVLPLLAAPLLSPRRSRSRRLLVGLAICVAAWLVRDVLHRAVLEPDTRTWALELTQRRLAVSRVDQLVLGVLAAAACVSIRRSRFAARARSLAPLGVAFALALLLVAFRLEGALFLAPGGSWPYALMSLATALFVLATALAEGALRSGLAAAPLRGLGVVSYGVFLYHQLALGIVGAAVPMAAGDPTWTRLAWTGGLAMALSALLGFASYALVELPCMKLGK